MPDRFDDLTDELAQSLADFESSRSEQPPADDDADSSLEAFTDRVRTSVGRLEAAFESAETFDKVTTTADDLWTVLDEGEDVFDSFDAEAFFETVDVSELPNVIELANVPEAVESGDLRKALDLKALAKTVDFREFWSSEEMQKIWEESKEFSDALGGGSGEDDADSELAETTDKQSEIAAEATEGKLQSQLAENVEDFREQIETARDRLQQQIEASELGSGGEGGSASESVTAGSTMPENRPDMEVSTGFSTMPSDRPDIDVTLNHSTMPKGRTESGDE
ncbi:hypothetical protein [Haladaptatus caseinilyticus]|uniref:hypothetical protein n=1 Tax=Haladaptatus caseinilyticus TaxID=2993314 RepID=UPI00224AE45B|nr:hypothetical protein [Haladaptatus caseinilyticus]